MFRNTVVTHIIVDKFSKVIEIDIYLTHYSPLWI